MLGFVYARGGGGWYALADSKFNYLGKDAYKLSRVVADRTLASEMSYLFSKTGYFIGPVQHLIEFFSSYKKLREAERIWDETYKVIKYRLPIPPELDVMLTNETPSFNHKRNQSINTSLNELIGVRKKIIS